MEKNKILYRWCNDLGGGLVYAKDKEDALNKLKDKYKKCDGYSGIFEIWLWEDDDYYNPKYPEVLDIY